MIESQSVEYKSQEYPVSFVSMHTRALMNPPVSGGGRGTSLAGWIVACWGVCSLSRNMVCTFWEVRSVLGQSALWISQDEETSIVGENLPG